MGPAASRYTETASRDRALTLGVVRSPLDDGEGSCQPEELDGSQTTIRRPGWNLTTERRVSKGDLVPIYVWYGRITGNWDRRGGHDGHGDPQMT